MAFIWNRLLALDKYPEHERNALIRANQAKFI